MDYDTAEAALARKMLTRVDRSFLVTDTTKFGKRGLAAVCRYDELDEIITDAPVNSKEAKAISAAGVALTVAAEDRGN